MAPVVIDNSVPDSSTNPCCQNHPEAAAERYCGRCNVHFCTECVKSHRVGNQVVEFCPLCGGTCERNAASTSTRTEEFASFYSRLPSVFMSPFRGDGPIILIAGTIFFALVNLAAFVPFIGFLVFIFGAGYLAAFLLNVITTAARGDESLPSWPDFTDSWNDIVRPCLLVLGTVALCLGPAIAYRLYSGFSENAPTWPYWIFLAAGGVYFPMALLGVALFDGLHGANPLVAIPSIAKVPGAYSVTCLVLVLLYGIGEFGRWLSDFIPLAGAMLAGFLALYLAVVQMRLLGTLYHAHRDDLNWF